MIVQSTIEIWDYPAGTEFFLLKYEFGNVRALPKVDGKTMRSVDLPESFVINFCVQIEGKEECPHLNNGLMRNHEGDGFRFCLSCAKVLPLDFTPKPLNVK